MFDVLIPSVILFSTVLAGVGKVLLYLALLSVLIIFHEFGHFICAKLAGVTVTDFAVGFGPSIIAVRRGDTTYRINALPLGGYCKMLGEDTEGASTDPGNFNHKSVAARFGIIAAGPIFNIVLAIFIFSAIAWVQGVPTAPSTVVESVNAGMPAAAAGLQAGDEIVALGGVPIHNGQEMLQYIRGHNGATVQVDVVRKGRAVRLHIPDRPLVVVNGQRVGAFGFTPQYVVERASLIGAVGYGVSMVGTVAATNFIGIVGAIRAHDSSVIHGPVGIARIVIGAESYGFATVASIAGQLSVMLGLINLLPLPALDGGRLAFLLVEFARGRPINPEREGLVHLAGFALLMVFVVFVTYNDIVQWIQGKGGL